MMSVDGKPYIGPICSPCMFHLSDHIQISFLENKPNQTTKNSIYIKMQLLKTVVLLGLAATGLAAVSDPKQPGGCPDAKLCDDRVCLPFPV